MNDHKPTYTCLSVNGNYRLFKKKGLYEVEIWRNRDKFSVGKWGMEKGGLGDMIIIPLYMHIIF